MGSPPAGSTTGSAAAPLAPPPTVGPSTAPEATPNTQAHVEVDTADETDSAIGSDDGLSETTSLASSVLHYKFENGRRYHAYREGKYFLPNDEQEQDRMDLLHHIYKMVLDDALFRAPLAKDIQKVIDFGTGTGVWAIDFADKFPSSQVIGTDLSPIQPKWVPPNCKFVVDDVTDEWVYPLDHFDYIHGRTMAGSIADWEALYSKAFKHLAPGGWMEMQETEAWCYSDDGTLSKAKHLVEWQEAIDETSSKFGKRLRIAAEQKIKMEKAGFVNVRLDNYKVPIGPWPKDPKLKLIGRFFQLQMLEILEPISLALFTRVLGWSMDQVQAMLAGVRVDLKDKNVHCYAHFFFLYGQKPEA